MTRGATWQVARMVQGVGGRCTPQAAKRGWAARTQPHAGRGVPLLRGLVAGGWWWAARGWWAAPGPLLVILRMVARAATDVAYTSPWRYMLVARVACRSRRREGPAEGHVASEAAAGTDVHDRTHVLMASHACAWLARQRLRSQDQACWSLWGVGVGVDLRNATRAVLVVVVVVVLGCTRRWNGCDRSHAPWHRACVSWTSPINAVPLVDAMHMHMHGHACVCKEPVPLSLLRYACVVAGSVGAQGPG